MKYRQSSAYTVILTTQFILVLSFVHLVLNHSSAYTVFCLHGCFSKVSKNHVNRGPPVLTYHKIIFQVIYPKRYQEAKEKPLEKIDEKVEESNYDSEFESETSDNSSTNEEYDDTVVPTEISAQSN